MNIGDIVEITDGSYSLILINNKLEHSSGIALANTDFEIIATNCKNLPTAKNSFGQKNDTIVSAVNTNRIVYIKEKFLRFKGKNKHEI